MKPRAVAQCSPLPSPPMMRTRSRRHRRHLSRLHFLAFTAAGVTALVTCLYLLFFDRGLVGGDWDGFEGFTRLLIPDTYVYANLIDEEFSLFGFAVAGVKNALVPSLMWLLADGNWYAVALMNAGILLLTLVYTVRLCDHFGLPPSSARFVVLAVGLMPSMAYYSVGALKELPSLLAMTGFFLHYLKGNRWRWLAWAFVLFLCRYQTVVVVAAFWAVDRWARNPVRAAALLLVVVSAAYPLIKGLGVFSSEAAAMFREDAAGGGAVIESIRDNVPILSALAVLVRVAQTTLEPLITLVGSFSLFEDGALSVLAAAYTTSLLLMLPSLWRFIVRLVPAVKRRRLVSREAALLQALILLFAVPVAGFSFVHHRYLFPVTVLVMLAGSGLRKRRRVPEPERKDSLQDPAPCAQSLPS